MSIEIKSFNQILGNMVRKIVAETPVSDINPGSIFLSLLEACASNDFDNNVAILNILELLNVDAIRNSDLDNKAADLGLTRKAAVAASGVVTIYNTNITKQSTNLYSLKPAPISGQTTLFVTNTEGWSPTGSLYIGRGTTSFEGPIAYTGITTFATYSQITLGSALQKDHLTSDTVINAQGQPDRRIAAGTLVKIPANNQSAEIVYSLLREAVIPAGEDKVEDVLVIAQSPGSLGNALINTITQFESSPFVGAAVSNTQAFSSGSDIETDVQLRNRVKSYTATLARGTSAAILNAVIGISDPDENKRVASAVITDPVTVGDPAILYVDDGSGFQPSYSGQAVDTLLTNANGTEEFLQLANYPLPRPQVVNTGIGPFFMADQMFLRVSVDRTDDLVIFETADFVNIASATVSEVVAVINEKSTTFKARLDQDSQQILLYPVDPDAELLQVVPLQDADDELLYANSVLAFPTEEVSYITLYQNSTRLFQRARRATVETISFASWNLLAPGNLILSVDGTPAQDGAFTISDFVGAASFDLLTLDEWVTAINAKFAGITAVATSSQTVLISSNKDGSSASIEILGGDYQAPMFSTNEQSAVGQESEFEINRQTGNIRILTDIEEGDSISAGVTDTKGYVVSEAATSGTFNLSDDDEGLPAQMVIVADATFCDRVGLTLQAGDFFTTTPQSSSIQRIMASTTSVFRDVQPGHYIYIAPRSSAGYFSDGNTGLFHVLARGEHLTANTDSYIEVRNLTQVSETVVITDVSDIVAFSTDAYPQVWRNTLLDNPASATLSEFIDSINDNISGVRASAFRTTSVKLTSTTEQDGSIAVPVSIGRASIIVPATTTVQLNNDPLVANKVPVEDVVGFPRVGTILSRNTYMDRTAYPLVYGDLSADAIEDVPPYTGTYSELVQSNTFSSNVIGMSDLLLFTRGDNRGQLRSIAAQPTADTIGTQPALPRTAFNHIFGDNFAVLNSLKLGADDHIVCVMDNDATTKTVDIAAARSATVNSGSDGGTFIPTSTEFSADDSDNEEGVDFSDLNVWGTELNGTDFSDYAILMRARNWYASGGTAGSDGKMIIRSAEYGANGNNMRFSIDYPSAPDQDATTILTETPSYSKLTYYFGSGSLRTVPMTDGVTSITPFGPYSTDSENFPAGAVTSGMYWDLVFYNADLTNVQVGDILVLPAESGMDAVWDGVYSVIAKGVDTIRVVKSTGGAMVGNSIIDSTSIVWFYPPTGTAVSDIVATINESNILVAAAIGDDSLTIMKSTDNEKYAFVSDATALAYLHDPDEEEEFDRASIGLFDGINWVKNFSNTNPNFTTKVPFALIDSGVDSSVYAMNTAPNEDETVGEKLELVPTTVQNVQHHLTQRAMSQLQLLSDIELADRGLKVQIVSEQLGSAGGIQVLGGLANQAQTDLIGESQIAEDSGAFYLQATTAAYPNSFAVGDMVKLQNRTGVARQTPLTATDSIDVDATNSESVKYLYSAKATGFVPFTTTFTITDVSATYGATWTSVWRWTHSFAGAESLADVNVGDVVAAYGFTNWDNGNMAKVAGDGSVAGWPIVAVDDANHTFDVLAPFGKAMPVPTTFHGGAISIFPAPQLKWTVTHTAPVSIGELDRTSNVVTVTCAEEHWLNTGDTVVIKDSTIMADGTYSPVTVISPIEFTISDAGIDGNEVSVGATATRFWGFSETKYRLEPIGVNNLVRLSTDPAASTSPYFRDNGVAVDDYIVISGNTFDSSNNGTFRVLAVDNNSVVFENPNAIRNVASLVDFNNIGLTATWTANSVLVTGIAGTFKNLQDGLWVKKQEDDNSLFLQVIGCNTNDYTTATSITLADAYGGISGSSEGTSEDQTVSFINRGVVLKGMNDVAFYEGDATLPGDTLFVQNLVRTGWFSTVNSGNFTVVSTGTNTSDYRPYIAVENASAVTETDISPGINLAGFYVVESDDNRLYSYRQVAHSTISESNSLRRSLYLLPDSRSDKFSEANGTYIQNMAKLAFDLNAETGIDGYLYYTGLLRRVQRTVDGYGPDPVNFPERKAIGSRIETLPPLIKNLRLALTIVTNQGSTTQDISNNVKSAIIDYVNGLGVGQDVILSAIIAKVMQVRGVASATFTLPDASEERIGVASNEKALVSADNIGIN